MTHPGTCAIEHLMLIDDNSFDQMIYQRISQKSGMVDKLIQFTDATRALDHLANPDLPWPSLILLDINMPKMDGFEFLEEAVHRFGTDMCPIVVMLTTSLNPRDERRAKSFEIVQDFLSKPLTQDHLSKLSAMLSARNDRAARASSPVAPIDQSIMQ